MSIPDTFLLDEVRCGFMIPAAVKQAWAAELEVLMEIDRVCKKYNIQYFADWGTLLGTVRHGGFIPWDDDLDIVMKREDYTKFLEVAAREMEEGFEVRTFRNHNDNWLFMAKVLGRNSFCFEKEHLRRFHNFPYIASVDIFVLDYVYRDLAREENRRTLCKTMLGIADLIAEGVLVSEEKERRLKAIEEMYGKKFRRVHEPVEMRRYLYGEVEKIFGEVPKHEADFLTQIFPRGLRGDDFQFPKEYYEKTIHLPFESTTMPVPMMYDTMLHKRYGEYVRFVKDSGGHNYPFFEGQKRNLQKVLDFELPEFCFDKEKLFRSGEENACRNLSYKVMANECADELLKMKTQICNGIGQVMLSQTAQQTEYQECVERVLDLLQASQQLAIDFGNMMEQILGERCKLICLLEQYCEALYIIYEILMGDNIHHEAASACDRLNEIQEAVKEELQRNVFACKTVLFLPVFAKDWERLHSLWQEYAQDELFDVYVAPLPYYYKDYDNSPRKVCCEAADFPENVHVIDYNILTPEYLEMLHPEVIVIQNPYDSWNPAISVPEMFYSENIRKYTDELIYVLPFVLDEYSKRNEREYSNMKYYVTMPGVVYADRVLVQSENMRQVYIEKLTEFAGEETGSVWERRVCVQSDGVTEQKAETSNPVRKKKMLYGISLGAYMVDVEAAKSKIENNLILFEENKAQIDLTVWVFPEQADVNEIRDYIDGQLKEYSGKRLERAAECRPEDYDAYYGDAMPLVMQFRDVGKPVMIQDIYVK